MILETINRKSIKTHNKCQLWELLSDKVRLDLDAQ